MSRALPVLVTFLALAGCNQPEAPSDEGVCWRLSQGADRAVHFSVLSRDVSDLDTCAVLLEGLRLEGEPSTNGAYQGYFIFVDDGPISSARSLGGFRYPIFQPPQRVAVDRDLRRLMQARGGHMPGSADIDLERR